MREVLLDGSEEVLVGIAGESRPALAFGNPPLPFID
jgi:hypothetical protein